MKRITNIDSKLQNLCASEVELKESAKRALMAYMRSIYLMSNKKIFQIEKIDIAKYSQSLGLVVAPRIRFLQQKQKQTKNNKPNNNESSDDESNSIKKENLSQKKIPHKNLFDFNDNNLNNDSFFTVKKNVNLKFDGESDIENVKSEDDLPQKKVKIKTKASIVKQIRKKNIKVNEKVQFDDDGNRIAQGINVPRSVNITDELVKELDNKESGISGINIEEAKKFLENERQYDKELEKARIKRKHTETRIKEKELRRAKRQKNNLEEENKYGTVTLGENDDSFNENIYSEDDLRDKDQEVDLNE